MDAGNTRVKWALHDGRAFVRDGRRASREAADIERDWAALPVPHRVVIASVAGQGMDSTLARAARRWGREPSFVTAAAQQCGVTSCYADPSQLGPDRWAALVAARSLASHAQLVVCAGTAVTIDCLFADGDFAGGVIVPGFDLMHEVLAANAARLSAERGQFRDFPQQTRDAITSGAIQSICGAIERMGRLMADKAGAEPAIVATGGAAELIAGHLRWPVQVRDKLILEGLVRIAGDLR